MLKNNMNIIIIIMRTICVSSVDEKIQADLDCDLAITSPIQSAKKSSLSLERRTKITKNELCCRR